MPDKNLSNVLFSKSKKKPETSILIHRMDHQDKQAYAEPDSTMGWYRVLKRAQWIWMGIDPVDQEAILARITTNEHPRSYPDLLDTVVGYIPGNWIYEWTKVGMNFQKKAQELAQNKQDQDAGLNYLKASAYFSVAAYPYLKEDELATHAITLAHKNYEQGVKKLQYSLEYMDIKVEGKTTKAVLHLPKNMPNSPIPVLIVCAGLDISHTELWRLYHEHVATQQWAMVSLDMPSFGYSQHIPMTENISVLHEALLEKIAQHPYLDQDKIAGLGIRLGANALTRLAYLKPKNLKAVASLSPMCHTFFKKEGIKHNIPDMYLDILASSLGKKEYQSHFLLGQFSAWSLKHQGLLGIKKSSVPFHSISLKNDPVCPLEEAKLIASSSREGSYVQLEDQPLYSAYERTISEAINWLKNYI